MPKVIDAFLFSGELDILEIRLNELDPIVDHFVIVEGCERHGSTGERVPTWLDNTPRWAELMDKFGKKIKHVVLEKFEPAYTDAKSGWERENYHRQALTREVQKLATSFDDVVIVSDVDEIPRAAALRAAIPDLGDLLVYLRMDMYMFNVNSYCDVSTTHAEPALASKTWDRAYMCSVKTLLEKGGAQPPRGHLDQPPTPGTYPMLQSAGWHLSSFMDLFQLRNKLRNYAHSSDFPHLSGLTDTQLASIILTPRNIFNGKLLEKRSSDDPRLPQYFLDHQEKFKHFTREPLEEQYPAPDVTIGVIRGMDWTTLAPYANSLSRCGFKGARVMFVENEPEEVVQNLRDLGFVVLQRAPTKYSEHDKIALPEHWAYGYHRFEPVIELLKNNRFRFVIWTDTRDVVFQADPVPYLETMFPSQIAFAGLSHVSAGCPYNDNWIRLAAQNDELWQNVRHCQTLACGTFAGTQEAILDLMQDMYDGCAAAAVTDQGMFNCLIRTSPYAEITHIPAVDEPFSAQWWPEKRATANPPISHPSKIDPVFDEATGEVRTWDGELYPIVHLYERSKNWLRIMREKYA